ATRLGWAGRCCPDSARTDVERRRRTTSPGVAADALRAQRARSSARRRHAAPQPVLGAPAPQRDGVTERHSTVLSETASRSAADALRAQSDVVDPEGALRVGLERLPAEVELLERGSGPGKVVAGVHAAISAARH